MIDHDQNVCVSTQSVTHHQPSNLGPKKRADKLILLASPCDLWPLPSHSHLVGSSFMASKAMKF